MKSKQICTTCKTGANTVEGYPYGCPYVMLLEGDQCCFYVELDDLEKAQNNRVVIYNLKMMKPSTELKMVN